MKSIPLLLPVHAIVLAALVSGCATSGVKNPSGIPVTQMEADERGFVAGTGIESQDIVAVTDKMARSLVGVPEIANFPGVPRIVLDPVRNNTRFRINEQIFLEEIMLNLNEKASGKVRFVARDRLAALEQERELKRSGQVTSTTDPNLNQFKGADFILTGDLLGQSTRTSAGLSDYVLYSFKLIDPNTTEIIWQGSERIKKQGLEDTAYR